MNEDYMLEFLGQLRSKFPQHNTIIDVVEEAYKTTSMPKMDLDTHYLAYPPGHFYSPLPSKAELQRVGARVFLQQPEHFSGIELRERDQFRLFAKLAKFYKDVPFADEKKEALRYFYNNDFFCHADAYWLYAMMREFKPKRIIEVGSGFSSCVMLDTNDLFFEKGIDFTFIEPFPDRLLQHMHSEEREKSKIMVSSVQDVPLSLFVELESNDILFIDSSHVGKIGSDVLYLFHEVLPLLKPGVLIHLHDIFYPFEYPRLWHENSGRAWNECYFLRSFLQFNTSFEILLFGNWLGAKHADMLHKATPLCLKDIGGSFWMRRVG